MFFGELVGLAVALSSSLQIIHLAYIAIFELFLLFD